jgi:hypothetical protein
MGQWPELLTEQLSILLPHLPHKGSPVVSSLFKQMTCLYPDISSHTVVEWQKRNSPRALLPDF